MHQTSPKNTLFLDYTVRPVLQCQYLSGIGSPQLRKKLFYLRTEFESGHLFLCQAEEMKRLSSNCKKCCSCHSEVLSMLGRQFVFYTVTEQEWGENEEAELHAKKTFNPLQHI